MLGVRGFSLCRLTIVKIAIFALVFLQATIAWGLHNDYERFTQLKREYILNPDVSNQTINAMLFEGIESPDPEINKLIVQALDNLSAPLIVDHQLDRKRPSLPERTIHKVVGLKQFLIDYWTVEHARSGFNASKQLEKDLKTIADSGPFEIHFDTTDPNATAEKRAYLDELWQSTKDQLAEWISIPQILALYWPKDKDVHTLIWEYHARDDGVNPHLMLGLFNIGQFVTPKANSYWTDQLVAYRTGEGLHADLAISAAARGLALSHPEAAIPNLIKAGLGHIKPREDVLITLAGYEYEQLDPYYLKLAPLISVYPKITNQKYQNAMNRLLPYAKEQHFADRYAD